MAPDFTDQYNTALSPAEEALFQAWAAKAGRLGDTRDYDLRGAWKANAHAAANGHLPDTYKKPNHPTFSSESIYNGINGALGGKWTQQGSRWIFQATPYNVQNMGPDALHLYFRHVEPDSLLVLPGPQP
jgi:hypothetical protein